MKPGTAGPQLIPRDGDKLKSAPCQSTGGSRRPDRGDGSTSRIAVDEGDRLVELDVATFEKLVKPLMKAEKGKPESPVVVFGAGEDDAKSKPPAVEVADKLVKAGQIVQTSEARFANGIEATLSARQSVLTYHEHVVNEKPNGPPQFVKEGFKLVGLPIVSADRRFVRFKLAEQSVALKGIKKDGLGGAAAGGGVADQLATLVITKPELEDLGATGSAVVADGGTVLFRLAYAPKDKVWVLVLRPTISIHAEEDALKEEAVKKEGKN